MAGVRLAIESGLIGRGESVVAVLTGHLLKDPAVAEGPPERQQDRNEPVEIDASLSAIENELGLLPRFR